MKPLFYLVFFIFLVYKTNAGPFKSFLYSDWITCDHNKTLDLDVSEVQVFFYDFQNNFNISYQVSTASDFITTNYNLDVTKKLIFFVAGYKSHISKPNEELIRTTFRDVKNIYLIIIDHSTYTHKQGGKVKSYERSVLYTYYIGKALGKLLAGFRAEGFSSKNIHCIGHSLGGQMLATSGEVYTDLTKEKLWRITALDPAGPCFSNGLIQDQIRSGVAEYVEVYHCNAGGLGTTSVLGDIDFFMNNGKVEPKCNSGFIPGKEESDAAKCSHKKCVKYYALTVHQPSWYVAWKCDSDRLFSKGKCSGNEMTLAGYFNPGNATGLFYTSTETYGVF